MNLQTLRKNQEFRRVYRRGDSQVSQAFVIYRLPNSLGFHRIGYTVTKKLGNAVMRNRLRRRLKEVFNQMELPENQTYDFVVVARHKAATCDFQDMLTAMRRCMNRWS